ncbi:PQQ-dependent sugar dehydrogenase [Shewanella sp. NFH-SH190041]|uniref:PQQ-dependent sugar dehydrogenase n=1 Tax=Shewanella sp. NFH-SH190041 TaxID=2950245 RepID=UPI0021C40BA1|nr:PQQ-dependent sugar dehydrogenase [Shewanella sp. NFH-SH190041]
MRGWKRIFCIIAVMLLPLFFTVSSQARPVILTVAKGFGVSLYASGLDDAKQLALGPEGTLFVSSGSSGRIIALSDDNHDGRVDRRYVIDRNLDWPQAMAFADGNLYVAQGRNILAYRKIEQRLRRPPRPQVVFRDLPLSSAQVAMSMAFSPDGQLYLAVGAGCNVCLPQAPLGSILALDLQQSEIRQVATGVRQVLGMDWSPQDNLLWFADDSREWMGDNLPADEINRLDIAGSHFGFPFIHGRSTLEPMFNRPAALNVSAPVYELPAHVSPAGVHFYRGQAFPPAYQQQLFVAEHGSDNRSSKVGYQLVMLTLAQNQVVKRSTIVSFLDGGFPVARPFAIITAPDGAMYISDDMKGNIYRLFYRAAENEQQESK